MARAQLYSSKNIVSYEISKMNRTNLPASLLAMEARQSQIHGTANSKPQLVIKTPNNLTGSGPSRQQYSVAVKYSLRAVTSCEQDESEKTMHILKRRDKAFVDPPIADEQFVDGKASRGSFFGVL